MYTIRFPLRTTFQDEQVLEKRFRLIAKIHNNLVSFAKKQLRKLKRDPVYTSAKALYTEAVKAEDQQKMKQALRVMNDRVYCFGLHKTAFDAFVKVDQHKYARHLSSQQCQKEAERVFRGVEAVLYGNGKDVHYKKHEDFSTICGKSPTNGIRLYDEYHTSYLHKGEEPSGRACILWQGLEIPFKIDWKDKYVADAMRNDDVSYCEIQRLMFNDGWHYYVRIYFKGEAPQKLKPGNGRMGIDPGVSTVAAVGEKAVFLRELAPNSVSYNNQILRLQRQIDASTRASNPDNYNADGTVKRGKRKWKYTKTCKRKKRRLKVLYRKKSAAVRSSHEKMANLLIQNADEFYVEGMSFSALGKRSKKTERQEKASQVKNKRGEVKQVYKYKRKKRFGKSLNNRAPALFVSILQQKCRQYGLKLMEINTRTFKASQFDHTTGECTPCTLNQRFKIIGGHKVQRDLYSAFLIRNSDAEDQHINEGLCAASFPAFLSIHAQEINTLIVNGISMKQCFGF